MGEDVRGSAATQNQNLLASFEERFRRSSRAASAFLEFLRRSGAGIWRFEPDASPSRWWINVTLPTHQAEIFGLNREIQVLFTEYEHVEPRTLSLVQKRVQRDMRVESDLAILVSRDAKIEHAAARRRGEMAIVSITLDEIESTGSAVLGSLIAKSITTVDHYDVSTPVREPSGFYGRQVEIEQIEQDLDRAVSVGIFGLRKAGKTSLLNLIIHSRSDDPANVTVRVDVSEVIYAEQFRSSILEGMWKATRDLLRDDSRRLRLRTLTRDGVRRQDVLDSGPSWIQDLRSMLEVVEKPAVLVIDEIDQAYPPRSTLDRDEARGLFSALVQLRSLLQEQEKLALLCAGVDPALFERPTNDGRDNLLYKLVRLNWLAPMKRDEMAEMVRSLGRRMGVRVRNFEVIDLLYRTYGGHPLLTRKACSLAARSRTPDALPYHITTDIIEAAIESNEYGGPKAQSQDVIESFTEWFPAEAALLRMKFSGSQSDSEYAELVLDEEPNSLMHATAYGLCFEDGTARMLESISSLRSGR